MREGGLPRKQGLYDPAHEHDACGVGFVAHIEGVKSHEIVQQGLEALRNLEHRGACGCDPDSGDGAGILIQMPDAFLRREAKSLGIDLPEPGAYACAMVFLALDESAAARQRGEFERIVREEGQTVLGWREVPCAPDAIGPIARQGLPRIQQLFIGAADGLRDLAFERKLYVIRRLAEKANASDSDFFYVPSCSSRTLVYTGMLISRQIHDFYPDLEDRELVSALALAQSRYSTNTMPPW